MPGFLIKPKNWDRFQHYKNRNPPWIKLHKDILDDYDWWQLPIASRALAPCLWMLASCYDDGIFDASYEVLSFRFRMTENEVEKALKPLIDSGYFIIASNTLACSKQSATPEKSREETEDNIARSILMHLNNKTNKNFKPVKANISLINARLKDGFTLDDLINVIDVKTSQWLKDEKMKNYLRPSTLFNSEKCAQYSGEKIEMPKPRVVQL